jgi:hypothetical protein
LRPSSGVRRKCEKKNIAGVELVRVLYILRGVTNISGFEESQTIPVHVSGRGTIKGRVEPQEVKEAKS